MRLDDFVCLGRTVPEESKKYGRRVCMAGFSSELRSLIRVYPLPIVTQIRQRSVCELELERNSQDSRAESWKLRRERGDDGIVGVSGEQMPTPRVIGWLEQHVSPSIADLNKRRMSLGIIKAKDYRGYFRNRHTNGNADPCQRTLFEDVDAAFGDSETQLAPYLRFSDDAGPHDLQLREWGCYEWIRKEVPEKAAQLWDNLRLTKPGREVFFVVGNMSNQRTAWLVISIYSQEPAGPLFD